MVKFKTSIFENLPIRLKEYLRCFKNSKRVTYYYHFEYKKLDDLSLDEIKHLVDVAIKSDINSLDQNLFQ